MFDLVKKLPNCQIEALMTAISEFFHQWIERHISGARSVEEPAGRVANMAGEFSSPENLSNSCLEISKMNTPSVLKRI